MCIRQAIMALNTQPSPNGNWPMPTKALSTENSAPRSPYCGSFNWSCTKTQRIGKPIHNITHASPSTHMVIQVANLGEGMICCHTPSTPYKNKDPFSQDY